MRPETAPPSTPPPKAPVRWMPSWRAFKMTFSLCACSWRRGVLLHGPQPEGLHQLGGRPYSSMCNKVFGEKHRVLPAQGHRLFHGSSCGVMPMPPFRVVCRAVGRAPGAKAPKAPLACCKRKTGLFQTARIRRVAKSRRSAPAKEAPSAACALFFLKGRAPFSKRTAEAQRLYLKRKPNPPPRPSLPP